MTSTVTLPIWLFVLILVLAGASALTHILVPSVRWFFRRRMERLVARLNTRLAQPIQPFKLMRRADNITRLIHDPQVMEAVVTEARTTGEPESVVFARARAYAREIVPAFSASLYFGLAVRLAKWLAQLLYMVRVGQFDAAGIAAIDKDATIVFVMNHRSNMDYVLVTHLVADRSTLSYAVGEWANIWPLSWLIRSMGAYMIRRRSENQLYRRVLSRYVRMATDAGVAQAFFPEGRLSRDGRMMPPKLGLYSYIITGFQKGGRDVVFVPVALSFDRVFEDRSMAENPAAAGVRVRVFIPRVVAFVARMVFRRLTGRFRRVGHAAVSFGTPLSLTAFLDQPHADPVAEIAHELMARIGRAVTILPVPLIAAAMGQDTSLPRVELIRRAEALAGELTALGAHVLLPGDSAAAAANAGIGALEIRGILRAEAEMLTLAPEDRAVLGYYASGVTELVQALHPHKANFESDRTTAFSPP